MTAIIIIAIKNIQKQVCCNSISSFSLADLVLCKLSDEMKGGTNN